MVVVVIDSVDFLDLTICLDFDGVGADFGWDFGGL